jgi:hypothetical protein
VLAESSPKVYIFLSVMKVLKPINVSSIIIFLKLNRNYLSGITPIRERGNRIDMKRL